MSGVPFSAYVTEHSTRGDAVFRRTHLRAVLVQQEVSFEQEERGFETKHMRREEIASALLASGPPSAGSRPSQPTRRLGRVHRIEKRPGGVFPDRIGLGRAPNADVSIPLPRISKYHAYLTSDDGGKTHAITDAGSTNGTLVNDAPLAPKVAHRLHDGDVLQLGPYVFVYLTAHGFADWVAKRSG